MSYYRNTASRRNSFASTSSKKNSSASITNPEIPVEQVLKMQNLLEEYDREN